MYAWWALKLGKLPDEVDELPLEWSSGWLFDQMARLDANPVEWWKVPVGVGFTDDGDEDYDPAFDAAASPPPGWERLPMHEEVSDGE